MKNKTMIITAMCAVVILMSVGYAAFSTNLKVNGTANIASTWKVVFTNITRTKQNGTASEISSPTANGTNATFNVGLTSPGDYMLYTITVANQGTLNAKVNTINLSDTGSNAVIFTTNGISAGDILAPNTTKTFTVKVEYKSSITSQPSTVNLTNKLTLNIEFVQAVSGQLPDTNLLPADYQQVEYIESNGLQYILTDSININQNDKFRIKYRYTSSENSARILSMSSDASFTSGSYFNFTTSSGSISAQLQYGVGTVWVNGPNAVVGQDYEIYNNTTNNTLMFNNQMGDKSYTNFNATGKMIIFGGFYSGTTKYSSIRLYTFEIENKIQLIPCYRKSDNVIGMYDVVNDNFYINQGSGSFTKGSNVN